MVKWILRVLVGALLILLLGFGAIAGLPWLTVLGDGFGSGAYKTHLAANETVLDLAAPDGGFALSEADLEARYIFLGEMHGYGLPQRLDLALVTYVQRGEVPRWYLAELTPREAIAVNHYLEGGSDTYVRAMFDRFAGMSLQWANSEFFDKLTAMRALNETLPPDRQVRFIGIDLDRSGEPLALPETGELPAPDLGDFSTAQAINHALLAVPADGGSRYGAMRPRLAALAGMPGHDAARFVGLWGLGHTSEAPIGGGVPLAIWLQDEGAPYGGEVVTINTLCVGECFNMLPAVALPAAMAGPNGEDYIWLPMGVDNPYFQRPKGIGDLMAVLGPDAAALYRISGEGSPYETGDRLTASSGYLVMMRPWEIEGSAAAMTDYMIVYRGTPPLTPWAGEAHDLSGMAAASLQPARQDGP